MAHPHYLPENDQPHEAGFIQQDRQAYGKFQQSSEPERELYFAQVLECNTAAADVNRLAYAGHDDFVSNQYLKAQLSLHGEAMFAPPFFT
jgi:hypothetical protein